MWKNIYIACSAVSTCSDDDSFDEITTQNSICPQNTIHFVCNALWNCQIHFRLINFSLLLSNHYFVFVWAVFRFWFVQRAKKMQSIIWHFHGRMEKGRSTHTHTFPMAQQFLCQLIWLKTVFLPLFDYVLCKYENVFVSSALL